MLPDSKESTPHLISILLSMNHSSLSLDGCFSLEKWNFKEGTQAVIIQSKELNNAKNRMIYAIDYKRHKFRV